MNELAPLRLQFVPSAVDPVLRIIRSELPHVRRHLVSVSANSPRSRARLADDHGERDVPTGAAASLESAPSPSASAIIQSAENSADTIDSFRHLEAVSEFSIPSVRAWSSPRGDSLLCWLDETLMCTKWRAFCTFLVWSIVEQVVRYSNAMH